MALWLWQAVLIGQSLLLLALAHNSMPLSNESDRLVEWVNLPNAGLQDDFLIKVTVNDIAFAQVPIDTGSTGFLVSAKSLHYEDDTELKKHCKKAFQYLSSSRRFYEGYWLPSTLVLQSVTGRAFTSSIPVFAVTESGNCSSFKNGTCTKDQRRWMPTGIQYMGVGFGRWSSEQPHATVDKNALLNIDFGSDATLRSGYIVSREGLVLGLRSGDLTDNWALTNLTRNLNPGAPSDRPEWNGTPMSVQVAGSRFFVGTALFDTGINYCFLGVPPSATQNVNVTDGKTVLLTNGTEVVVKAGNPGQSVTSFSFKVGDFDQSPQVTPNRVRVVREHADGAFINTGRTFFNGFSMLFDQESGTVGLKPRSTEKSSMTRTQESEVQWSYDAEL